MNGMPWSAASRARLRARLADDSGSTLPLVIFYGFLGIALVLIVAAAASLYLERKRLFTLADGAALVGAESFDLQAVTVVDASSRPTRPHPVLKPEQVRAAVGSFLADNPANEFEELAIEQATTVDGESATVTLSALWHPPVITVFVPDGLRVEATALARSVFG